MYKGGRSTGKGTIESSRLLWESPSGASPASATFSDDKAALAKIASIWFALYARKPARVAPVRAEAADFAVNGPVASMENMEYIEGVISKLTSLGIFLFELHFPNSPCKNDFFSAIEVAEPSLGGLSDEVFEVFS